MNTPPSSRLWWTVPGSILLLLAILALIVPAPADASRIHRSTYESEPEGFRAAYLTLEELGVPVARGRRPPAATDQDVRVVLFPTDPEPPATRPGKDAPTAASDRARAKHSRRLDDLAAWVRAGGVLVLGDESTTLAERLGLKVTISHTSDARLTAVVPPERLRHGQTTPAWRLVPGTVLVDPISDGESWGASRAGPVASFHRVGRGTVCLIHVPLAFSNKTLRDAERGGDNAIILHRLAEDVATRAAAAPVAPAAATGQSGRLVFDETVHGLVDKPGVLELMLTPPASWVTAQGTILLLILLWRYIPPFGSRRPEPVVRRRSKDEFLDALGELLSRKRDYGDAYRSVRDGLRRELVTRLGLPPDARPDRVADEARRVGHATPEEAAALAACLTADAPPPGTAGFLNSLATIDSLRARTFHGRRHR